MSDPLPPTSPPPQAGTTPSFSQPHHVHATTSTTPAPSVFDQTTQNLLKLGSLTIDKFAQDSSEELDIFDIPLVDPANPHAAGYYLGDTTAARFQCKEEEEPEEIPQISPTAAVRYLREVSQKEFGTTSTDPLKYEFLDGPGQNRKSCILTITRPNGLSRSYRTNAEFSRRSEAKLAAANSAIQFGAIRFIKHGDASIVGKKSLILAKLDAGLKNDDNDTKDETRIAKMEGNEGEDEGEMAVTQIEKCCREWRAGSVVPKWVDIVEQKIIDAHGSALKIALSTNIQRAYSVPISPTYPTQSTAKAACARIALEQGVLEFIKHGDGLECPILVPFEGAEALPPPAPPTVTTLQGFYAALPKPLPDVIGIKSTGEINAVAWLNTTIQGAKGSRMSVSYIWHMDPKLGLHGCLLRLARPDAPSQSYLVDAIFSKRADAKIAVCLLACSQGVGDYIRAIWAEVDARVTPEMRRRHTEVLTSSIGRALNRFRHGTRADFFFESDLGTFGCTMTIDLSSESETPIKRQWKVPLLYRCKADAKIAVMCAAADDGVVEFIKYHGNPLTSEKHQQRAQDTGQVAESSELEEGETTIDEGKKKKRGKKDVAVEDGEGDSGDVSIVDVLKKARRTGSQPGVPLFETREEALARGRFDKGRRQQQHFTGKVRGGGFGRPPFRGGFGSNYPNARGMGPRSGFGPGFGPDRPRPFGGFSVPPPDVPYFHQPHPYAAFSRGPGLPGHGNRPEKGDLDASYYFANSGLAHGRYAHGAGGAGADTTMSFAHAPPPALPHVAPAYNAHEHYDYAHKHHKDPYLQPPFSGSVPHPGAFPPHPGVVPPGLPSRVSGYEYPDTAPGVGPPLPPLPAPHMYHQTSATDYSYQHKEYVDRPVQSGRRAYEPEHYAPDYDCIPDRGATVREPPTPPVRQSHTQAPLRRPTTAASMDQGLPPQPPSHPSSIRSHSSHSHSSVAATHPPRHPRPHPDGYDVQPLHVEQRAPEELPYVPSTYDRPPAQPASDVHQDEAMRRRGVNERAQDMEQSRAVALASRPLRLLSKSNAERRARIGEKLDSVISRLEEESNQHAPLSLEGDEPGGGGKPSQLPSPVSTRKLSISYGSSSPSHEQTSRVPSKRGRSSDWENPDSPSNKRLRGRSMSRHSEGGQPRWHEESAPSSAREKTVLPEDGGRERQCSPSPTSAAKGLKRARESPSESATERGSEQKEKSYVAALFDHCEKEGMPLPDLCHEVVSDERTDKQFKVWIVMGKERLELPTSFATLVVGQERVAKSVLGRLRMQTKRRKEG